MADRWWVANSGNWSDNANHWSASQGGAPNASKPTSADNVKFIGGFTLAAQTVTVNEVANCLNHDWTGATNTPTLAFGANAITVYGDATFIAAMIITGTDGTAYLKFYGADSKLTTNTLAMAHCSIKSDSGKLTLQDDIASLYSLSCIALNAILDTNGKTVTCVIFRGTGSVARTITLGSSTINATYVQFANTTNLILSANTSTINIAGVGTFEGGGATWYNVNFNGTAHTLSGGFTCNIIGFNPAGNQTITWTDGTTYTYGDLRRNMLSGIITFQGSGAAGYALTRKDNRGISNLDYMSISRATVLPINQFYAGTHSTDGGNNAGIIWGFPPEQLVAMPPLMAPMRKSGRRITV